MVQMADRLMVEVEEVEVRLAQARVMRDLADYAVDFEPLTRVRTVVEFASGVEMEEPDVVVLKKVHDQSMVDLDVLVNRVGTDESATANGSRKVSFQPYLQSVVLSRFFSRAAAGTLPFLGF
jgi:hypothetical protein